MTSPPPALGLRHVALRVRDLAAVERFFVAVLGYRVAWRPDADAVYLESGADDLALHRAAPGDGAAPPRPDRLDHLGIAVPRLEDVDAWAAWLAAAGVPLLAAPRTHRDGARSLYLRGPEDLVIQILHHAPLLGPAGPG